MKTIEEFYKEILADSDLKAQCAEAIRGGKLDEFLKAQSCAATADEIKAFLDSKNEASKEVSFDELDSTAGGGCAEDVLCSICGLGVACAAVAIISAVDENIPIADESALC